MQVVDRKSSLWRYLTEEIQSLVEDGERLLTDAKEYPKEISDYSYLVFPFAKAYEGFLKRLFLDLDMITEDEYYGEKIRIGRVLNPFYGKQDHSVYEKLVAHEKGGKEATERLWKIWREGRNQVFHYFPHNFRRLTEEEAFELIEEFVDSMEVAVKKFSNELEV